MIKLNGVEIKPTIFPDKTSQVWLLPVELLERIYKKGNCEVEWVFDSEAEFMHLAQLKTLLDTYVSSITLRMKYLPYARQDKRVDNNSTFALHAFAKVLNALHFTRVEVLDVHNAAQAHRIEYLTNESAHVSIVRVVGEVAAEMLLFPDAGALDRYYSVHGIFHTQTAYADKVRNQTTGIITGITIHGDVKDKKVLIIDDLCDGGATFCLVAKQALAAGAKEVSLYVTHGIFSKGVKVLFDAGISRVFTHDGEVQKPITPNPALGPC